jgi:uncharacterized protein YcgI (DUF1989 family)
MEFVLKNSADKLEKHLIDPQTGIAFKVRNYFKSELK